MMLSMPATPPVKAFDVLLCMECPAIPLHAFQEGSIVSWSGSFSLQWTVKTILTTFDVVLLS